MPQQQHRNGHKETTPQTRPRDQLDLQSEILESSESNPLLDETNLGLGKYDDSYKWQQIRSYRKGLYAWIAFGRVLSERQIYETKMKLGREGYKAYYDDDDREVKEWEAFDADKHCDDDQSRWTAIRERGERIWQRLGDAGEIYTAEQLSALAAKTGITEDWKPLFWELVSGRHEMSRSENAELLRDALTGVKELRDAQTEEDSLL